MVVFMWVTILGHVHESRVALKGQEAAFLDAFGETRCMGWVRKRGGQVDRAGSWSVSCCVVSGLASARRFSLAEFLRMRLRTSRLYSIVLTASLLAAAGVRADPAHEEEYRMAIRPMLEKYCHECHRADKAKGDLDLTAHLDYEQIRKDTALWENVRERIFAFEMPPEGKPAPEGGQRDQLLGWLGRLPKPEVDCTKLASDRTQSFYEGHVMSRRLTRAEYERTIRDLVGLPLDLAKDLPADGAGGEGLTPRATRFLPRRWRSKNTWLPQRWSSRPCCRTMRRRCRARPGWRGRGCWSRCHRSRCRRGRRRGRCWSASCAGRSGGR
jgi:hypothetical protein